MPPAPLLSASNVRRLVTTREPGTPIKLVALFRAPPPVLMVAGKMWVNDTHGRPRRVTVIGGLGAVKAPRKMLAIRRAHAWVAYADHETGIPGLVTTGPLDPRDRDIVWAWGWKSKSAKALQVMEALL